MWDLPRPGLETMSPALAGGFLTTAPPGKSRNRGSFLLFSIFWGGWPKVVRTVVQPELGATAHPSACCYFEVGQTLVRIPCLQAHSCPHFLRNSGPALISGPWLDFSIEGFLSVGSLKPARDQTHNCWEQNCFCWNVSKPENKQYVLSSVSRCLWTAGPSLLALSPSLNHPPVSHFPSQNLVLPWRPWHQFLLGPLPLWPQLSVFFCPPLQFWCWPSSFLQPFIFIDMHKTKSLNLLLFLLLCHLVASQFTQASESGRNLGIILAYVFPSNPDPISHWAPAVWPRHVFLLHPLFSNPTDTAFFQLLSPLAMPLI